MYESLFLLRRSLLKPQGPRVDSRLQPRLVLPLLVSSTKRKLREESFSVGKQTMSGTRRTPRQNEATGDVNFRSAQKKIFTVKQMNN